MFNYKMFRAVLTILFGYLLGSAFGAYQAQAMDFEAIRISENRAMIIGTGKIELDDDDKLQLVTSLNPDIRLLMLDSIGGNLYGGLAMAQMVREKELRTYVPRQCKSACVPIFMAGIQRVVKKGALIGVHKPLFNDTGLEDEVGSRVYYHVLGDMIASLEDFTAANLLVSRMYRTPAADMFHLSPKFLERLGVDTVK